MSTGSTTSLFTALGLGSASAVYLHGHEKVGDLAFVTPTPDGLGQSRMEQEQYVLGVPGIGRSDYQELTKGSGWSRSRGGLDTKPNLCLPAHNQFLAHRTPDQHPWCTYTLRQHALSLWRLQVLPKDAHICTLHLRSVGAATIQRLTAIPMLLHQGTHAALGLVLVLAAARSQVMAPEHSGRQLHVHITVTHPVQTSHDDGAQRFVSVDSETIH